MRPGTAVPAAACHILGDVGGPAAFRPLVGSAAAQPNRLTRVARAGSMKLSAIGKDTGLWLTKWTLRCETGPAPAWTLHPTKSRSQSGR